MSITMDVKELIDSNTALHDALSDAKNVIHTQDLMIAKLRLALHEETIRCARIAQMAGALAVAEVIRKGAPKE